MVDACCGGGATLRETAISTAALRFALRPRDLSTYRVDAATAGRGTGWVLAPSVRLHVGTSSADIRASVEGDVATA